jgi:hypothetical protein
VKKYIKIFLVVSIVAVTTASVFVHPYGRVKQVSSQKAVFAGAQLDPPVAALIQKSCQDCHSERTAWPWYSRIAPISWMIEKDVREGREHFNMSHWDEYSPEQRMQILSEISVMVRTKQMPLPKYLKLHQDARLKDADIDLIYQWGRKERKRLKSAEALEAGKEDKTESPASQ